MPVIRIPWGWIRRPRHNHPVNSRKSAKVIVEGMVLLENNHHVIDLSRAYGAERSLRRRHVKQRRLREIGFMSTSDDTNLAA
jgi:hypothetical protein